MSASTRVKHAVGLSQARRLVRGTDRLIAAGVPTPRIVSGPYVMRRSGDATLAIELEFAPGRSGLELLSDEARTPEPKIAWAHAVGSVVLAMVDAGLVHRDLKLSNLIIDADADQPRAWVIDAGDVLVAKHSTKAMARMLDRLAVQPINRNIELPRALWMATMRTAMRSFSRDDRQAVIRRLRAHPQP